MSKTIRRPTGVVQITFAAVSRWRLGPDGLKPNTPFDPRLLRSSFRPSRLFLILSGYQKNSKPATIYNSTNTMKTALSDRAFG
ncbi:hypothetical protein M8994_14760 [Brucella sp. 21LCYQ03]|nr:hypothetical protein [Brucella sp. 21LCYQ03]